MRRAIDAYCKWCIVDPKSGLGTWRQQTEACEDTSCPLWEFRPCSRPHTWEKGEDGEVVRSQ